MTDPAPVDATVTDRRRSLITDVLWGAAAALASLLLAAWKVGAPASLPWLWSKWDLTVVYGFARALERHTFITPNPDLAFPFGQDLASFPTPDLLSLAELKALVAVTGDPLAAVNAYLLLSFALVAASMFILLRVLRVPPALSAALSLAFSLIPWHFDRFVHPFIANYSSVPIGLILVTAVLRWNLAVGGDERIRGRTLALLLALAVYVGLAGPYFAAFISILAVTALVFQILLGRRDRGLILGFWLAAMPVIVAFAAGFVFQLTSSDAVNTGIARAPQESQIYSGALYTLFRTTGLWSEGWPIPGLHLVPTINPALEADARLSTVVLISVIISFLCVGMIVAGNGDRTPRPWLRSLGYWPWLFLLSVLFFVAGGLGQVFAFAFLNQIRSWGRFSIVIAAISLVILGLLASWAAQRSRSPRMVRAVVAAVIAAITVADLVTMTAPMDQQAVRTQTQELRDYGQSLDAALPEGCGVVTVPLYPFPEWFAWDGTAAYDPLLPYLTSDHARWSYGGVLGTEAGDWALRTLSPDVPTVVRQAKAAGFCAVQVDTASQADFNPSVDELAKELGSPIAQSSTGRWVTFGLDAVDPSPFTRDYILNPVAVQLGDELEDEQPRDWSLRAPITEGAGSLVLTNPSEAAAAGTLALDIVPLACTPTGEVTLDTGTDSSTVAANTDATATVPVTVPADGSSTVQITVTEGCQVEIRDPRFIPAP